MSEIVILVESITSAGWVFFGALGVVALGFVIFDHHPAKQKGAEDAARPGARRAA